MKKFIMIIFLASLLIGLFIHQSKEINKNTNSWLPFFITNKNTLTKWENNKSTNGLPANGEFSSISCTNDSANKICVAAGYSDESKPLLATSKDDGITWNTKIAHGTPSEALKNGVLYSVSCTGNGPNSVCAAVGQYRFGAYPLPTLAYLAVSKDSGSTWYIKDTPGIEILRSVSCTGSGASAICTAVGGNKILVSTDGGNNFSSKLIKGTANESGLSSVSCFGGGSLATCVAVGSEELYPLIVTSKDGGSSWYVNKSANLITKNFSNGLASVSCANSTKTNGDRMTTCIAGGIYMSKPVLIVSHDEGVTWNISKSDTVSKLAPDGCLQFVQCIDNKKNAICMAESNYEGNSPAPIIITSTDSGDTWDFSNTKNLSKISNSPELFVTSKAASEDNYTPIEIIFIIAFSIVIAILYAFLHVKYWRKFIGTKYWDKSNY